MKTLRVLLMIALPMSLAACVEPPTELEGERAIPVPDDDPDEPEDEPEDPGDEPCIEDDCPQALIEPGDCEGDVIVECVDVDGECVWVEECIELPPPPPPPPCPPELHIRRPH